MSRYARTERVMTPDHGAGIVREVLNGAAHGGGKHTYIVTVDNAKHAMVYNESDLAPAPQIAEPTRCADCLHHRPLYATRGIGRCALSNQLRALTAPRACSTFTPTTTEETS